MTRHSTIGDKQAGNGQAGNGQAGNGQAGNGQAGNGQAGRVWAAMRDFVDSHPTKRLLREALDLGRGSGRVKSLLWLAEGPLSLSGLAEAVGVDAPYATLIVDSLEQRGLVERQPDPEDRRRKLVTLTPAGKDAVARVLRIQREPPPGFGNLSPAELDTLEELVRRLAGGPVTDLSISRGPGVRWPGSQAGSPPAPAWKVMDRRGGASTRSDDN
jgi:DNA-binding MarR family transcriptional regulator